MSGKYIIEASWEKIIDDDYDTALDFLLKARTEPSEFCGANSQLSPMQLGEEHFPEISVERHHRGYSERKCFEHARRTLVSAVQLVVQSDSSGPAWRSFGLTRRSSTSRVLPPLPPSSIGFGGLVMDRRALPDRASGICPRARADALPVSSPRRSAWR